MVTEDAEDRGRCPMCGGSLREGMATLPFVVKDSVVVVKDVTAEVCGDCGEAFMNGEITDAVTRLVKDAVSSRVELAVVTLSEEISSPVS